ncbi:pyridoxal phosphate-dependent aminotransferase [Lawsonibacter sp. OA9]|uniref:pyridoxal phosphate-dependent aminotransferase n=1 Tax=Eubacteriales TaxID=186802 RepID=UPI000821EA3C|nr:MULTISPECIES: pyridoxal phosphate-dependent aminotransferase [Oscillospiraceae]MBS5589588.1 pyridoxal phosphate-dependent aminotransferase [Clostridiales bacterium]MCH1979694.1 pyridoxal phosphate-dependent aminotransferase [Lawsonibacter sp. OA9]MCU6703665.1 pyridoxal phosphate-dependent aminotransferase [Muriventricola aceti]SCJ56463.1 Putative aminotransferase A [uncultured Flavonifractor sp.]
MQLSNLAQNLGGSVIREMFNEALKMEDTISFTVGEPDFITPRPIIEEACRCWESGMTHYTPNSGVLELRQAIAEYHANDLKPDPTNQIMVSCGATEAIQMALFTLVNPGDEVIVITPAWPNYFGQIGMVGARMICVPAREENGFIPDPDDIKAAITPKTKAIILNSPSNPTGAVIDKDTCKALADLLRERDIFIIADEIYSRLVYDDAGYTSITSFDGIMEKTVYISGFSKMFAMTGWRLGYAISQPDIIRNMTKLHENGASCLPAPSQIAAACGLRQCQSEIENMRQSYLRRRDLICSLIDQTPGLSIKKPKGAFYAFVNAKELTEFTGMNSRDLCMDLLKKTGVVTVPGSGFGDSGEGFIRITYATSDENIKRGFERIQGYIQGLGF